MDENNDVNAETPIDPRDPRRFNLVYPDDYNTWLPDFLGSGFEQMTIPLDPDNEGECVCTLVRYRPENDPEYTGTTSRPTFSFLAIHGWNDYFYHPHLARRIAQAGGAFYALDLRKYGRSLRPEQTLGFITDLSTYDEDIRVARRVIAGEHGADAPFILYGHSTGGLTTALWAHRHPESLAGLVLNSPWLEFQSYTALRTISSPLLSTLRRVTPQQAIPTSDNGFYQKTLTAWRENEAIHGQRSDEEIKAGLNHLPTDADSNETQERAPHPWAPPNTDDPFWTTGWNPDPRFRGYPSWAVRTGWLSAILDGHASVAAGLDIECPVLVLTSAASVGSSQWCEECLRTDTVLDVGQIWKRTGTLGRNVTLIKLAGAIHDVTLSRESVRTKALDYIAEFSTRQVLHTPLNPRGSRSRTGLLTRIGSLMPRNAQEARELIRKKLFR